MNIIDTIRVSGTDYTLSATTSGGVTSGEVETMISAATSGYTARFAEDEEVTAAALNDLNERISGISGNNVVELTQAQYDALVSGGTVDQTVFYIITDAQAVDLTQYWTSAQTNSAINAAVSGKQDTLSAGTGIDITDNVISATGGGGKAVSGGTNISITTGETADTINCTLPYFKVSDDENYTVYGESHSYFANKATYAFQTMFIGNQNEVIGSNPSRSYTSNSVIGYNNKINSSSVNDYSTGYNVVIGDNNSLSGTKLSYSYVIGSKNSGYTSNTLLTGWYNQAYNGYESVLGKYNVSNTGSTDADKSLFSVGNGTSNSARHNAFEIRQNGDIYLTLDGQDVKLQDKLGGSSITVDSELSSTSENPVQNKVIYNKIDEVEQVTARALNELNDKIGDINTILESI